MKWHGKSKKDAYDKYHEHLNKISQGLDTKKQYFGIVAENWIYTFLVNDTKLKNSTKDLYVSQWNKTLK